MNESHTHAHTRIHPHTRTVLVKKQIERLQAPALQCVDAVFAELKRVASHCEQMVPQLQQFPVLKEKLITGMIWIWIWIWIWCSICVLYYNAAGWFDFDMAGMIWYGITGYGVINISIA